MPDTMVIHSAVHTFFFIDPTLSDEEQGGGDGSSVAQAARHFPTTLENNKIYLIRRSAVELYADLPRNTNADLSFPDVESLVIIGMPKQDDPLFSAMPEDAQTAWIDPERDYAFIRYPGSGYYRLVFNNCRNFYMSRVCMQDEKSDNGDEKYCINLSSSFGTNMLIEKCRFKYYAFDFTLPDNASSVDYRRGSLWICGCTTTWGHSATIRDCVIDIWGRRTGLHCGKVKNIVFENIVVNAVTTSNEGSVLSWTSDTNLAPIVTAKNITHNVYYASHRDSYMRQIISGRVNYLIADGLTVQVPESQGRTPYDNRIYLNQIINVTTRQTGTLIENGTFNLPMLAGRRGSLIYVAYQHNEGPYMPSLGQYNIVRKMNITMAQTYPPTYSDNNYDWYENPFSNDSPGLIRLVNDGDRNRLPASDFLLQDIHISAPMGVAMCVQNAMLDLSDCDVVGCVEAACSEGKIKSITTWYPGYALNDSGANTLYVNSITCNRTNPRWEYNAQAAIPMSFRSYILCGSCNTRYVSNIFSATDEGSYPCAYICTSNATTGRYTVRNAYAQAETWSVNRTGSDSACSLKLSNEVKNDWNNQLQIGGEPFKGITKQVTAGTHTATFYMALYGYNDPTEIKKRFTASIKLPDGTFVRSQEGNWSEDAVSVWNDIDGSTNFKLDIPFTLAEDGEVEFSYGFSWYMADAAIYVDPFPTIV